MRGPGVHVYWLAVFCLFVPAGAWAEYRERLRQPRLGDVVQVLWEGAFNLITDTVACYQGRAWWEAEVVDRAADGSVFRIHYPHCEAAPAQTPQTDPHACSPAVSRFPAPDSILACHPPPALSWSLCWPLWLWDGVAGKGGT